VPIHHLMEDAATAEISRAQLWQWVRHGSRTDAGTPVTLDLLRGEIETALAAIRREQGEAAFAAGHYARAAELLGALTANPEFEPFLTLIAYRDID
jgi:malate synthase